MNEFSEKMKAAKAAKAAKKAEEPTPTPTPTPTKLEALQPHAPKTDREKADDILSARNFFTMNIF